jgi:hypothetical protein
MSTAEVHPFRVPHYDILRILSDRETSKLFLARREAGTWAALKLELPSEPGKLDVILRRYRILQGLSAIEGFTRIFDLGQLDSGWIWHSMPLADNLPGLPPLDSETGLRHYTPLTLASWIIENGPANALQVATWGQRIATALTALHEAGLVHRDVKPANLLFLEGQITLSDYGLVGEPGSEYDLTGTEGFIPLEGTSDRATDQFALGKTLYHAFSGKDPLEFPSLPVQITERPDWAKYGIRLNAVILRACHGDPRKRFGSARQLSEALSGVLAGKPKASRRRWLVAAGSLAAVAAGACIFHPSHPAATAVWRRVRQTGFNVECWQGNFRTVDWARRRVYSVCKDFSGFWLETLDLNTFTLSTRKLNASPPQSVNCFLHPVSGKLWAVEGGLGEVYEIDVDTGAVRSLGGGPDPKLNSGPALYWNPVTGRVGSFGGYGALKVNNSRHEFDEALGRWIEVTNQPAGHLPWPRALGKPLLNGLDPAHLFLAGGSGSPSGVQGAQAKGLRGYNSQFYNLDDIWELDLRANRWTELLSNGGFPIPPQGTRVAFFHPGLRAIIFLAPVDQGDPQASQVTAWMIRPGIDPKPVPIAQQGETSRLGNPWTYALDPATQDLLLLAEDGIFVVTLRSQADAFQKSTPFLKTNNSRSE